MAIYYVDTASIGGSASDSNNGTSTSTPWLTLGASVGKLNPGDTLNMRAGTYTGTGNVADSNLITFNGGSSGSRITIQNYGFGTGSAEAVITQPPDGHNSFGLTTSTQAYITIQGLIIDGSSTTNINYQGIYIAGGANNILLNLNSVRLWPNFGIAISNNNGAANLITVFECFIHGNGSGSLATNGHGIYNTGGSNVIIDGCNIYSNLGYGIQNYESDGFYNISSCITRNNVIYNNGRAAATTSYGIVESGSVNSLVYNNIIYSNCGGILIYSGAENTGLYFNTIYNNTAAGGSSSGGIDMQYFASAPTIESNIVYLNESGINNNGGGTGAPTISNNYTSNPTFVNAGAANFNLQASSGAIAYGLYNSSIPTDSTGYMRPNPPAAGAYEYQTMSFPGIATLGFGARAVRYSYR